MAKQVFVVRKDLKMNAGKVAAQVSHAAVGIMFDMMAVTAIRKSLVEKNKSGTFRVFKEYTLTVEEFSPLALWKEGIFTKIVLKVDNEEKMLKLYSEAVKAELPCILITDAGNTVFNGVPTNTCIGIGPDEDDLIDKITGHLDLL